MPLPPDTLTVFANPYLHVDEAGRPCSACPEDPMHHPGERRHVGATLKAEVSKPAVKRMGVSRGRPVPIEIEPEEHDRWFEFDAKPVVVPNTDYYRRCVNSGELIAADVDTAKACGFIKASFQDPLVLLAAYKRDAILAHQVLYGEDPAKVADHWPHLDEHAKKLDAMHAEGVARAAAAAEAKPAASHEVADHPPAFEEPHIQPAAE